MKPTIIAYQLNVANRTKLTTYYRDRIGLQVLTTSRHQTILGVDHTPLLTLTDSPQAIKPPHAGLYHAAFLLPTATDLGNTLLYLLATKTPLQGAANHGYSEALYLQDPEGNGIELYHDQPRRQWDRRPDGRIVGITAELDGNHLIAHATPTAQLATGTRLGHLHLRGGNLAANEHFFRQLLGFGLKDRLGTHALFMATGDYHHHVAVNTWGGAFPSRTPADLGLAAYTLALPELATIEARLRAAHWPFATTGEQIITTDPNGSQVTIQPQ